MSKIVRKTASPPTDAQKRRLKKVAERAEETIDTSEIPPLSDEFWKTAVRNPFYRPVKQQVTLRLDADVISWLRRQGKGYQSRANALLRAAMFEDLAKPSSPRGKQGE